MIDEAGVPLCLARDKSRERFGSTVSSVSLFQVFRVFHTVSVFQSVSGVSGCFIRELT